MKASTVIASLGALAPVVNANFHLYFTQFTDAITGTVDEGWQIFDADPDCDDVNDAKQFMNKGDVSGTRPESIGVRCDGGCGPGGSPSDIDELEMHFANSPLFHWTIYKDRDYDLYGVDGETYGSCHPYPDNNYDCLGESHNAGRRKFECITEFSAADITDGSS